MNSENAIEVHNVTKAFKIYGDKPHQLKDAVIFHNFGYRKNITKREILKDISFDVKKGEALALIGRNGCGKSTTLKILTRILYPDQGTVEIEGRVASLIELGAGFHPDMSGRENIYINASIFGIKAKEVDKRLDEIINFSELEEFIDSPVRTYSSGMYMRLAFAVAINVNADVLLIDEILAVGDSSFQAKCFKKIQGLKESGVTIVLVSHSLGQVEMICDKVAWIDNGLIREMGNTEDVCQNYTKSMDEERYEREKKDIEKKNQRIQEVNEKNKNEFSNSNKAEEIENSVVIEKQKEEQQEELKIYDNERPFIMELHNNIENFARIDREVNGKIIIKTVDLLERENNYIEYGEKIKFKVHYACLEDGGDVFVRCIVRTPNHTAVGTTMSSKAIKCKKEKSEDIEVVLDSSMIAPGKYIITVVLFEVIEPGKQVKYDTAYVALGFEVIATKNQFLGWKWPTGWGYTAYPDLEIIKTNDVRA